MAKKKRQEKPKEYTRRQLSHFQKQKRRQRIIFISGVAIIVAIVLIVLVGWFLNDYRPMHTTLIKVGGTKFNTAYYIDMLKIAQKSNSSQSLTIIDPGLPNYIIQAELIRRAAQPLGITISDEEIKKQLEENGQPTSDAYMDAARAQQLNTRLRDEYFGTQVSVSDNQVHMLAMLVESESVAIEAREKIINGDNFTALVEQYAQDSYSKSVKGDYGLHPRAIVQDEMKSSVPLDFAFGAEAGDVSLPLSDKEFYKGIGYWLIKVVEKPSDNGAVVQALYLSSRDEALEIKSRLEAGASLATLSDQYSQYTPSKVKHGELGLIDKPSDNTTMVVSAPFDGYVFDPAVELGKWSDPISDTKIATSGGYWLVKVVEKQIDSKLSDEDRTSLIDKAFSDWVDELFLQHGAETWVSEDRAWAVARASEELA